MWRGQGWFANGTSQVRGVGILVDKYLKVEFGAGTELVLYCRILILLVSD